MKKAPAFISLAIIVFLSACGPQATPTTIPVPPTAVPATVAPATAAPTEAPPTQIAATEAPASPTPEGACTDVASFVSDVTIPDYSHLDLKEAFTKTWRVKN